MNISYNWLKEYVNFDLTPDETAAALTSIGLETGGVEEVQTIKGGLEGLVIGEVLTCVEHLTLIIYTLRLSTWETANRYKSFAEPRMWLPDKK